MSVFVPEANGANGMTADHDGRLVVCEQGSRWEPSRISRLDRGTGDRETVVEDWRGLPFNSPNDVVVASDGAIWFTDPSYGHLQGFRPQPAVGDFVYRHDPATGQTAVVADGFDKPNGIAFSPDERVLYVTDSGANQEPGQLPRHSPASHQGLRRARRPAPERRAAVRGGDARVSRRAEGRRRRPRIRVVVLGRAGLRPQRTSCWARSTCPAPSTSASGAANATSC